MIRTTFFSLFLFLLIGCALSPKKENKIDGWSSIKITLDNYQVININRGNSDSVTVTTYFKGTFFQPVKKVRVTRKQFFFTKAEKDSIYDLAENIVTYPIVPKHRCTDFAGNLELVISYGDQITHSCKYSSVCDWATLSDKTLKMNALLKRKIWHSNPDLSASLL